MAQPMTNQGLFLPTSDVYDTQVVYSLDINSDEFKEFLVRLRQSINNVSLALNAKDSGYYVPFEFVCGQQYYPNPALTAATPQVPSYRPVFREVVIFAGPLPNTATRSEPHNIIISSSITFTRIYGVANDTTGFHYRPLPYISLSAQNIELNVDSTNVNIITEFDATAYTITYVVLEYLKS